MIHEVLHDAHLYHCVVSDDERYLACVLGKKLRFYDLKERRIIGDEKVGFVYGICLSPDGEKLFVINNKVVCCYIHGESITKLYEKRLPTMEFAPWAVGAERFWFFTAVDFRYTLMSINIADGRFDTVFEFEKDERPRSLSFSDGKMHVLACNGVDVTFLAVSEATGQTEIRKMHWPESELDFMSPIYSSKNNILLKGCHVHIAHRAPFFAVHGVKITPNGTELLYSTDVGTVKPHCFFGENDEYALLCGRVTIKVISVATGEAEDADGYYISHAYSSCRGKYLFVFGDTTGALLSASEDNISSLI